MKKELTARQQEILDFLKRFTEENGYPPTYREIGKHFEIASTFGVKRHLDALIKKGYITTGENSSRAITILDTTPSTANDDLVELPIVGRIAAGPLNLAEENVEGTIPLGISMLGNKKNCFGLKVRGDSMQNAGIQEGDVVIVQPQSEARNGEIVVALVGNEATLKRFSQNKGKIILIPENENYQPIVVKDYEDFSIVGKVIGVFRWYN